MPVKQTLNSLGIKGKAQDVYLSLLSFGEAKAMDIAKKSQIKRSTVYDILNNLIQTGLVTSYTTKGVKFFVAENPHKIKSSLDAKLTKIEESLPELLSIYNQGESKPVIKMFEGEDGMRQIYEDFLTCKSKTMYSLGSSKKIRQALGSIGFTQRRVEKKIFSKSLRVREDELPDQKFTSEQIAKLREVRLLPHGFKINGSIYIHDNKVSVLTVGTQSFCFVVENKDFADTMLNIFNNIWEKSESTT